jgi:hypothetical protein
MECILVLRQSQSTETANTESQNSHGPVCHVAMFSPRLYCDFHVELFRSVPLSIYVFGFIISEEPEPQTGELLAVMAIICNYQDQSAIRTPMISTEPDSIPKSNWTGHQSHQQLLETLIFERHPSHACLCM